MYFRFFDVSLALRGTAFRSYLNIRALTSRHILHGLSLKYMMCNDILKETNGITAFILGPMVNDDSL